MVDQQLAIALQRSGRNREALALLDAIRARDGATMSACDRADLLTNLGWVALLAREARADAASPVRDPRAPLEEALTLLRGPCDAPRDRANVLVDLALAAALASDVATARARLVEARAELAMTKDGGGGAAIAPWIAEIDARIALGAGDAKGALEAYRRARGLAEATFAVDVAWRAAIGEGEAQEALSQPELALEAYLRAEAQLDEASADVAILEGRDAFLGDRERSARALVDLLVRLGRGDEALLAARRARGRAMAALARADRLAGLSPAERSRWDEALGDYRLGRDALDAESSGDWQLPADRLAAVRATRGAREERLRQRLDDAFTLIARARPDARRAPTSAGEALPVGTVLLTHHPLRRGWVAFAADAQGVASQILPSLPRADATPREQSDALLAPFQAKLATATRVRVLPYGPLHAVDFHALPFGEGALLDRAAVEYALDQASATDADTKADLARGAVLIVADPQGNLPSARREANAVERALAGRAGRAGGSVSTLLGAQATSPAVRRALEGASWLHYAGHADFAVDDPWRSELPLAEGGRLSIGDVLALPRAPAIVALFACESGRTDARAEGIGLAQAFLVAGSRAVFAATRPVADELAAELASEMYGNVGAAAPTEPANLLRRAQLAVRGRGDRRDWGAFRVLLP
jgi:Holliday junction resolvasome RuvABC endonuclease subunit